VDEEEAVIAAGKYFSRALIDLGSAGIFLKIFLPELAGFFLVGFVLPGV